MPCPDVLIPYQFVDGNGSLDGRRNTRPWKNADKMWAYVSLFLISRWQKSSDVHLQLHDLCLMHGCQHFVLSCYEQWAFGAFSTCGSTGMSMRCQNDSIHL